MLLLPVTHVLVIDNERLISELERDNTQLQLGLTLVKVAKSGGVIQRDPEARHFERARAVRFFLYS